MATILGIESTAHTFGIGIVKDGKILANKKHTYTTEKGGIIPIDAAKHHEIHKHELYFEAVTEANIDEKQIDAIAFSQGPGLSPCLLEGLKFAKELSKKLNKPLVPVNHCVAHLEIGKLTGAKNPVLLYASGANTQIIAYASGKYRIFGETLDLGVGNFIDTFARYAGIGFPGGPVIQKLASTKEAKYIELPYTVKGMDVAFSGILTNLKQKLDNLNNKYLPHSQTRELLKNVNLDSPFPSSKSSKLFSFTSFPAEKSGEADFGANNNRAERDYILEDLCFSLQETVFAMLVETAERAMAHTEKKELLIGGGVGCNTRLQEMCETMCKERGAKFFTVPNSLLVDNGAMIAYLGEIEFKSGIKFEGKKAQELDILPRQRTDDVDVSWR